MNEIHELVDDPIEMVNRFGQPEDAAIQQGLIAALLPWVLRTQDPLPLPRRRYVLKR